jgi:PAS domain-containing protein
VRSTRAHGRTHDLMMDIVDSAPAGILFLGPQGQIMFANDTAREVLDLVESPGTGSIITPAWTVADHDDAVPGTLALLVHEKPFDGYPVTVRWPSGVEVLLRASGRPMHDARDELGGVVVSFERPALDG